MPKGPRRTMTEYKKDVQEARTRRKLQEAENRKRLKQCGQFHMTNRQNILMGYKECNSSGLKKEGGLEYTSDNTDCLLCDGVQASAPAICAIIIDEDTMAYDA